MGNRLLVDIMGEFLWTLLVNFVHEKSSFWVKFHEHFSGEFSWTLFFNSNEKSYMNIKQLNPNLIQT